jgi:hypothetical protein
MPRRGKLLDLSDDGLSLSASVTASIRFRLPDQQTWDARVVVIGYFTSATALSKDEGRFFAATSGFYVLWPFARSHLDLVGRLAGVANAPQLPLLIRPAPAPQRGTEKPRP